MINPPPYYDRERLPRSCYVDPQIRQENSQILAWHFISTRLSGVLISTSPIVLSEFQRINCNWILRCGTRATWLSSQRKGRTVLAFLPEIPTRTIFSFAIISLLFIRPKPLEIQRHPISSLYPMIPPAFIVSSLDFQIRHILSLIPLCLLILEYIGTCRFEFTYIWSISKVLFVISRYYEIVGKAVHYCLIHLILGRSPAGISPRRCAIWYTLMFSQSVIMVLILDIVLFLRAPYVFGAHNAWSLWMNQGEAFDGICNVFLHASSSLTALLIGISFIVSHVLLWVGIYMKRNVGQGQVPVVKLVVREGSWIFIVLFALVAGLMPSSIAANTDNPFVTFICPTTIISVLSCRIIQNMHNIAINEASQRSPCDNDQDFQLTTFIHSEFAIDG
ncbi:hypothetical protein BJ165DRAFT_1558257 [Panaeolus papilionaceus]|nr:hypothetical protein BJ165DRAFT_1558257 [Panaeolus papilionaceus]